MSGCCYKIKDYISLDNMHCSFSISILSNFHMNACRNYRFMTKNTADMAKTASEGARIKELDR